MRQAKGPTSCDVLALAVNECSSRQQTFQGKLLSLDSLIYPDLQLRAFEVAPECIFSFPYRDDSFPLLRKTEQFYGNDGASNSEMCEDPYKAFFLDMFWLSLSPPSTLLARAPS